jgi:DNA polymerase-3 subunit gamma/tau
VEEIDAATNRGIDDARHLIDKVSKARPARDRYRIIILDEAHQITEAAWNALLKTLEEPPPWAVFMMCTTAPEDIPQTIRSRCQHFSFHAVRFQDIVGQLREIARKEGILADEDTLAVLAEAGDGSMRDALSILDQAIACCGNELSAEVVRELTGAAPAEALEQMMGAVARNSSEDVLRLTDKVLTEGQNPAHFARQMVRFLRNTLMSKVAGEDSPLLQVSADERARAARVAAAFSEEDLARFLQIMLRAHGDVSYRQDQRFHLELGLLKLVHAQRLLPLEELLSAAGAPPRTPTPPGRPARGGADTERAGSPPRPSLFEADVARKAPRAADSGPEAKMSVAGGAGPVIVARRTEEPEVAAAVEVSVEHLRQAVLEALEHGGMRSAAALAERGQWSVEGARLLLSVPERAAAVELALHAEARKVAAEAASAAAGRRMKLEVSATGASNGASTAEKRAPLPLRGKPAEDPVVRRMQEKFGAEIRSVIDHRQKR